MTGVRLAGISKVNTREVWCNEKGFAFLVGRFTGKEAAKFQEAYINQFDVMKKALTKPQLPHDYLSALKALTFEVEQKQIAEQKVVHLEHKVEVNKPKVDFHDKVIADEKNYTIGDVSKILNISGLGQNKLFNFFRRSGFLMNSYSSKNTPYQKYIDSGFFVQKMTKTKDGQIYKKTMVTSKGLASLIKQKGKIELRATKMNII